ncbi:hypothetical protein M405DRAFT_833213, partial [Rhizopogon salebrosus TDB-379]
MMDVEQEKQWWRNIAKEWYAQGLAVQSPALIPRIELQHLWAVLYIAFCKLQTLHLNTHSSQIYSTYVVLSVQG